MKKITWLISSMLLLTACQPASSSKTPAALIALSPTKTPLLLSTFTPLPITASLTPSPAMVMFSPTPTPLPSATPLDPAAWRDWPVLPIVPEHARQIYKLGQTLGNDPHAFSVFGDCNTLPKEFMGVFETDPAAVKNLPQNLQETVAWFRGSFNRASPTVRGGTTAGALLWSMWHQNQYTCISYETPLQCELRIHKPAFAIIQVGTHYEDRNEYYMRLILDKLVAAGVVPILATKADNRELDERLNAEYARLVVEYDIPFWNFWAALSDLPNRGLYTRPEAKYQGDVYMTDAAAAIHRLTALEALDLVRRAVSAP